MNSSKKIVPDFTEDLVGFMIQMMLTIIRFPRAPFALIPMSKNDERIYGADARIDSISPLYLQFKRSFAYPDHSNAKFLNERSSLKLTNKPRVLYFELREKQKNHADYQHNVLLDLRRKLQQSGVGSAVYTAPLFLNRSAYLLAVHFSSIIHWRPWHLLRRHPFFEDELEIITHSGSIRFQNCPVLREHICIPPYSQVTTHKHKYSYLENMSQVCFHSPTEIENLISLGQFLYNFIGFSDGQPTSPMVNLYESIDLLNDLSVGIFNHRYESQSNGYPSSGIDSWLDFGVKLKMVYDIDQYLLIRFSEPFI